MAARVCTIVVLFSNILFTHRTHLTEDRARPKLGSGDVGCFTTLNHAHNLQEKQTIEDTRIQARRSDHVKKGYTCAERAALQPSRKRSASDSREARNQCCSCSCSAHRVNSACAAQLNAH